MMVWARLQADVNCNLRRGAWYRLIKAQGLAAVVDVKGTPVAVVRAFLRPRNVPRSVDIGEHYAVCPSCRDRVPLRGRPSRMMCSRCSVEFAVDWEEQYLLQ